MKMDQGVSRLFEEHTKIQKFGASVLFEIPGIRLPIRSSAVGQIRDLAGLPRQTQFKIESRANYQFRKIILSLTHSWGREDLLYEVYSFHEIYGKITRQFEIF